MLNLNTSRFKHSDDDKIFSRFTKFKSDNLNFNLYDETCYRTNGRIIVATSIK